MSEKELAVAKTRDEELDVEEERDEEEEAVEFDIAAYPSDKTLSVLVDEYGNGDIIIDRDFQRNFVWSIHQASLLIESFLLGLPVPQVFLYLDENNRYIVIDGQQRILSVAYFFEGYFGEESTHARRSVFRLQGLSDTSPYLGKTFKELDDSAQRKLRGAVLRAINIRQLQPGGHATCIYHIFERLNTGGTPLKPQEIRNCVFRGQFATDLRELNKDNHWRDILGKPKLDRHQKDVELALRVFALAGHWKAYEKPMKGFLNKAMETNRQGSHQRVTDFKAKFPELTEKIVSSLGKKPFNIRGPLNAAVLDSVMCMIYENLSELPDDLAARFQRLKSDKDFLDLITSGTSDPTQLKKRFELAHKYLLT